jgi:hypothetical protein
MSSLPPLPTLLVKELHDIYDFSFNTTEESGNPIMVETTLDEHGLHLYGSAEAVMEFMMLLGHAVGANARFGDYLHEMGNLTENLKLTGPDARGDVEVQLPKFLVPQEQA